MQNAEGGDASFQFNDRDYSYRSIVSDLVSLIEHMQASMKMLEGAIARELPLADQEIGDNVIVLDDITPCYLKANAALHALAIASAAGAHFVRVNQWANAYVANEGLIEGAAAKAMRYRSALQARGVSIFADAHVKHGARHRSGPADRRTRSRRRVFQRRRRDLHGPAHRPRRRFRLSLENPGGRFASDACRERG